MAQAEIITIGTELLLGEIQDTNTRFIARHLRQIGVDLYRVTTVGDNVLRIAEMIRESLMRADIVITTGGLGPTIDDPTRNAAAVAFNVEMVFHTDLWQQIEKRFGLRGIVPTENNQRQAYLPANAVAIHNPVGTAPAFYIPDHEKIVICLPGVPGEMETIFSETIISLLTEKYALSQVIKPRVIHTSGIGESVIDDLIADLESNSNPTVGLSAHPGRVDIRITAKANSEVEAEELIRGVESIICQRLAGCIYGIDDDTLLQVIALRASKINPSVNLYTTGFSLDTPTIDMPLGGANLLINPSPSPLAIAQNLSHSIDTINFFALLNKTNSPANLELSVVGAGDEDKSHRLYNGPASQVERWAENMFLDFVWRRLIKLSSGVENEKS
ncbi:MAG: hypothetical protein KBD67_03540 [Anaerolineaceae bacterium]|nr:hypothetical protein [Anaerolineaceae bacterium]